MWLRPSVCVHQCCVCYIPRVNVEQSMCVAVVVAVAVAVAVAVDGNVDA